MTEEAILKHINWAINNLKEQGARRESYLFQEHHFGLYNFGYTLVLCTPVDSTASVIQPTSIAQLQAVLNGSPQPEELPYACIDYDSVCDCCGAMSNICNSVDIYTGQEAAAAKRIAFAYMTFEPACNCHERFGL